MRKLIASTAFAVLLSTMVAAQAVAPPPKPLHLRAGHWTPYEPPTEFPEGVTVHTVVKGDTLWDLAQKYLGDPYLWPQIWERNPYILDSHWIYPGDPVVIDLAVQPAPPSAEQPVAVQAAPTAQAAPVPEQRPTPEYQEYEEVTKALQEPAPLGSPSDVYCFSRLFDDETSFPFSIRSSERVGMQVHFSEGDVVYIDGGANQGVNPGDRFFVLALRRELHHPISNARMGTVYDQMGQLRVLCAQENTAIAEIVLACNPIGIGDVLLPFSPVPVPLVVPPDPSNRCDSPNGKPTGYIVFAKDDVISTANEQLVFVDLGTAEGLYPGMFATVFRDNPVAGMPRLVMGEVGILTVGSGYSTAKITRGWAPLSVGDRIEIK